MSQFARGEGGVAQSGVTQAGVTRAASGVGRSKGAVLSGGKRRPGEDREPPGQRLRLGEPRGELPGAAERALADVLAVAERRVHTRSETATRSASYTAATVKQ